MGVSGLGIPNDRKWHIQAGQWMPKTVASICRWISLFSAPWKSKILCEDKGKFVFLIVLHIHFCDKFAAFKR